MLALFAACATENSPLAVGESPSAPVALVQPESAALGGPPFGPLGVWLVSDVRVQMSDGTKCTDPAQTSAKYNVGVYDGVFPNCPGVSYHLEVHQAAPAVTMLISTFISLAALEFDIEITMQDGRVYTDIPRMW